MRTDLDNAKDEIIQRLKTGEPRFSICREFNCKYDTLKKRLDSWGITDKNPSKKGLPNFNSRKPASNFLYKNGPNISSHKLKLLLWRDGLKEKKCELCGWAEIASDGRLPLELHHINGDRFDNSLENLQVLCPNCHSLQPGNSGSKK